MRWLILGAGGQLGSELCALLPDADAWDRASFDLADEDAVGQIAEIDADVVINAAAWTAVDEAEGQPEAADSVNHRGPERLARALAGHPNQPWLLQVSTDYVFGTPPHPQRPWQEDDPADPLSVYGRTKWRGEQAVRRALPERSCVVRSAWLYSAHGPNFARTALDYARQGKSMRVVNDQWGQPTWARDLAEHLVDLGERVCAGRAPAGTYHGTNAGMATWWEFARQIYALAGVDPSLVAPQSSDQLDRRAPRPAWSVLGHEGWAVAGMRPMRPWKDAIVEAMPHLQEARHGLPTPS